MHAVRNIPELLFDVERKVLDERDRGSNQFLSAEVTRQLVLSGNYHKSLGTPLSVDHYRRSLSDGSCLHLAISPDGGQLHWDCFDPHRNLAFFMLHVAVEAMPESVINGWLIWRLLRLTYC